MALLCLSQHSYAGYREAGSIIGKLFKPAGDTTCINNVSAYVASSVKEARHKLSPGGAKYAGKGGWAADDPRIDHR